MLAVLERWLPYTVTILTRFHCNRIGISSLVILLVVRLEGTHTRQSNFESHNIQSTRLDYRIYLYTCRLSACVHIWSLVTIFTSLIGTSPGEVYGWFT